jgi:MFS family permease
MLISREEWRLLWPFYLARFMESAMSLMAPFLVIYLSGLGLSLFQISTLFAANYVASIVFEIPTGAVADIWGRKFSVLARFVVRAAVLISFAFVSNYYVLLALFFIGGVADTLKSGADEAWVVDWLLGHKAEKLFAEYVAKDTALGFAGKIVGPLIASLALMFFAFRYLWIIEAVVLLICVLMLSRAGEFFSGGERSSGLMRRTITGMLNGWRFSSTHRTVILLMTSAVFLWFGNAVLDLLLQPALVGVGMPVAYLGFILSGAAAVATIASLVGARFAKTVRRPHLALAVTATVKLLLTALIGLVSKPAFAVVSLYYGICMIGLLRGPMERSYFQSFVPSAMRATVTSIRSAIGTIGVVIAQLSAGYLADHIGAKSVIGLSSLMLLPTVLLLLAARPSPVVAAKAEA